MELWHNFLVTTHARRIVPSKRELIGGGPPSDGLRFSEFQWDRITAFVLDAVTIGVYFCLLFTLDSTQIPSWGHEAMIALLAGLLWYGLSGVSWREVIRAVGGMAVGGILTVYVV